MSDLDTRTLMSVNGRAPRARRSTKLSFSDIAIRVVAGIGIVFLLLPTVISIIVSFGPGQFPVFPPQGWTLKWFTSIDPGYGDAALTSVILAAWTAAISITVGVPASFGLARWGRGANVLQTLARAPMQVPYVVIGVMMLQFFVLITKTTGVPFVGTMQGLVIAHCVVAVPYVIGAVYPTACLLNTSLDDAAYGLGASRLYTFFRVVLPSLKGSIVAGTVFAFLVSFDDVPITLFLVGSNVQTLPVKLFADTEFSFTPELFAVSTLATVVTCVLVLILTKRVGTQRMSGASS